MVSRRPASTAPPLSSSELAPIGNDTSIVLDCSPIIPLHPLYKLGRLAPIASDDDGVALHGHEAGRSEPLSVASPSSVVRPDVVEQTPRTPTAKENVSAILLIEPSPESFDATVDSRRTSTLLPMEMVELVPRPSLGVDYEEPSTSIPLGGTPDGTLLRLDEAYADDAMDRDDAQSLEGSSSRCISMTTTSTVVGGRGAAGPLSVSMPLDMSLGSSPQDIHACMPSTAPPTPDPHFLHDGSPPAAAAACGGMAVPPHGSSPLLEVQMPRHCSAREVHHRRGASLPTQRCLDFHVGDEQGITRDGATKEEERPAVELIDPLSTQSACAVQSVTQATPDSGDDDGLSLSHVSTLAGEEALQFVESVRESLRISREAIVGRISGRMSVRHRDTADDDDTHGQVKRRLTESVLQNGDTLAESTLWVLFWLKECLVSPLSASMRRLQTTLERLSLRSVLRQNAPRLQPSVPSTGESLVTLRELVAAVRAAALRDMVLAQPPCPYHIPSWSAASFFEAVLVSYFELSRQRKSAATHSAIEMLRRSDDSPFEVLLESNRRQNSPMVGLRIDEPMSAFVSVKLRSPAEFTMHQECPCSVKSFVRFLEWAVSE